MFKLMSETELLKCPNCSILNKSDGFNSVGMTDENGNTYFEIVPCFHCENYSLNYNKYRSYMIEKIRGIE